MTPTLAELAAAVSPPDADAAAAARRRQAALAKPPGSLGRVEHLGAVLAGIAGRCPPPVPARPALLVAAGDHGVHGRGVSAWPQEVSSAIAGEVAAGRAAASVLARQVGATVTVIDVGLASPPGPSAGLLDARVRPGTRDLAAEPAMTLAETLQAVSEGAIAACRLLDAGADLLVVGDVGIANTTPSAALIAWLTGTDAAAVAGRGAGCDDAALARKSATVATALRRHDAIARAVADRPHPLPGHDAPALPQDGRDAVSALASLGGLEHAALVGAIVAAAPRVPVLLDGVTTLAAALVAVEVAPALDGRLLAGHRSAEPASSIALAALGLDPLLDLGLALGEGTGGLLAIPLVQSAARVLRDVASLDDVLDGRGSARGDGSQNRVRKTGVGPPAATTVNPADG